MNNLPNVTPEIIKAYQDSLASQGSGATAKRKAISLNRFFDWAHSEGKITSNPMAKEAQPQSSVQGFNVVNTTKEKKIKTRTWATIGLTSALIILLFLLTFKLKLPIPFTLNFAQEAQIQTNGNGDINNTSLTDNPSSIPANNAEIGAWNLFAKLKLTDSNGSPLTGSQSMSFKIYNSDTADAALYSSQPQNIITDANGSVLISLQDVPKNLFFENNRLFLEPQVGSGSAALRIPVSTASVPANLNGFFAADPTIGAQNETVPVIDSSGSLVLASQSPSIKAKQGNFLIEGQAVTLKTTDGSDGSIEINPDGKGIAHFLFEGNKGNFLNAQGPNLTSGSLYYGMVPNNATGYDLIRLQSGSPKMTTKFSVDALGNTYVGSDLNVAGDIATAGVDRLTSTGALKNITGYSQNSGNFIINQNAGDFASITKKASALSDVLNLTLDERGAPNSIYSTLTLNRFNGAVEGAALHVDEGNAIFDGQVQLGRFATNPNAIGQGSLVYNTSDNLIYVWDGSAWVTMGGGGSSAFDDITSGTNTTATMIVGSGASLSFSGTGTITASDLVCSGCVSNSELVNSSITFAGNSGSSAISLGGTENIVGGSTITTSQSGSTLTVDVASDSLDFAQFKDSLTLDASTDIATAGLTLSTSGTGALNFASSGQVTFAGNVDANNGVDVSGSNLTVATDTILNGNTTIGDAITDTITFNGRVAQDSDLVPVTATGTNDLGTALLPWDNIYGGIFSGNGSGLTNVDATTLDSIDSTQFLRSDTSDNYTSGTLTTDAGTTLDINGDLIISDTNIAFDGASTTFSVTGPLIINSTTWSVNASGDITTSGDLAVNGGDITSSGGTTTIGNALTVTGNTNLNGNTTLGNAITDNISFTGRVGSSILPITDGTYDLGSASLQWANIYGVNLFQNGNAVCDSTGSNCPSGAGLWSQSLGAIYPSNSSVDLLLGSSATTSAKFAFTGVNSGTPTASIAGSIADVATYLTGDGTLSTTNAQNLTIGSSTTGNVVINSRGSNALTANGANLTTTGTLTFPNTNTLTGVSNYLQLSQGVSVGGGTTYYFNAAGDINANGGTFAGDVAVNGGDLTSSASTLTINAGGNVDVQDILNADSITTDTGGVTIAAGQSYSGTGAVTLSSGGAGGLTLNSASNTITVDVTDTTLTASGLTTFNTGATLTFSGNVTVTGNGVINGDTTLGNAITDGITFNGRVAQDSDLIPITTVGTNDLGSALLPWDNIYGVALFQNGNPVCDSTGANCPAAGVQYWDQTLGALSPLNSSVDLLIGSNATASAKFAFTGVNSGTPTASIAGSIADVATYLTGDGTLSTTNAQDLTLGSATTGNVVINSRGSNALTADGANLTTIGTLTFPNTNTLTGVSNYLQLSQGISVGGGTTYYFSAAGDINANGGTFAGDVAVNGGDLTSSAGTLVINAAGNVDIQDVLNADSITTDTGGVTVASGQSYSGTGTVTLSSGGAGGLTLNSASNTVTIDASDTVLTASGVATFNTAPTLTFSNNVTVTGNGVINGDTTLGNAITDGITFTGRANSSLLPITDNLYDLGSASLQWANIYGVNLFQNGNAVCDSTGANCPSAGGQFWSQVDGALYPTNNTVDVLIGGSATASAKFAFTGVNSGTPTASIAGTITDVATYLTGDGTLSTTNAQDLTLGTAETGNIILNSRGLTSLTADGANLTASGNLNINGDTVLGNAITDGITFTGRASSSLLPIANNTYDLGSSLLQWANIYGTNLFQGGNPVCDSSGANCPVTGYWGQALGALYPTNNTVDVLIGSTATTSAKFAFTGVNSGTPTASISGTTANVATFLTGEGTLGTTNMAPLNIGNTTTGTITIGSNTQTVAINSSDWDITAVGNMSGIGTISSDGDWTNTQSTPTISFVDNTPSEDDYSINVNGNDFNITNSTDSRIEINFDGTGGIDLGDNTATKTIDIGGVTASAADIINIATNGTAADVITIGNSNAATTLALTGGDDWSISTAGAITTLGLITTADDVAINGGDLTTTNTTATLFNSNATTLSLGGAATTLNLGPTGSGVSSILLSGGSADTGCTLDGSNGNLTCSGNITSTATSGTQGWWQLLGEVLSPANTTWDVAVGGTATTSAKFQAFGIENTDGKIVGLTSNTITTGDVFNATASAITTGNILKLGEGGDQTFSGNVILADIDNTGGGGGAFTGNFLKFNNASSTKFLVDSSGSTSIGVATPLQKLTVQQDAVGNILGLYDGGNNLDFLLADAGVATFKPTAFDLVYTFDGVVTYANNTTEAKNNAGTPFSILALENPSNDIFYVGLDHKFATTNVDIATAGVGVTLVTEYWDGSAWTTLTVTDNTTNLTTDGTITFTAPTDWQTTAVNSQTKYWVRFCSVSVGGCTGGTGTNITTAPTANFFTPTTGNRFYVYGQSGDTNAALYINDQGNVGLGDITPVATLTVGNGDLFQVAGATGNITTAGDAAINGGDITSTATTFNFDIGNTGTLNFRDGTNTLVAISDQGTTGRLAVSDSLQVGSLTTVAYSRFGTTAAGHTGNITTSDDLMLSGDLELDGNLYLDGKNIYNTNGNAAIILCTGNSGAACATTSAQQNTLSTGAWVIDNQVNVGEPTLVVNNAKGGDLFDASASGTMRFKIANNGTVTILTTNAATVASLVVSDASGTGTGKIDVGTVDPPYTINGKKFATFLSGIVGVKEEVVGQATTNEYVAGVGYRYLIDFNDLPEGSDLWLFSKATDIKTNINKLVALLTPGDPTRVWYELDKENKRLAIYSARPTTISYRLTGPRFDHETWTNERPADSDVAGFILNIPDMVNNNPIVTNIQNMSDFVITKVQGGYYSLKDNSGNVVDGVESIGNVVAGNIKAGYTYTQELATNSITVAQGTIDNLLISTGLVTPNAKVALISPLPNTTDVTIKIGSEATDSGKLAIQNNTGEEVASVDTQGNATFKGDVHSQNIDEIQSILNTVATDQEFLSQIVNSSVNSATDSAEFSELATNNLYVTGQAAVNSLSVSSSIAIGNDLVINSANNSLNTINAPLNIQSLALAPVEIMAGKVRIETNGDMTILGNLFVAGKVKSSGFEIPGLGENNVASINASGSAEFNSLSTGQVVIAGAQTSTPSAAINGQIDANATVGQAIIPSGTAEVTIHNPKVTDYTLVYVTPTSDTQNKVLYIKNKGNGYFTLGFSEALSMDVSFNWWIVATSQ